MNTILVNQVKLYVKTGFQARSKFYSAMGEPDEQKLGSPATENLLNSTENQLNISLPPSYRVFLSLYNGWEMIDATNDLYSCEKIIKVFNSKDTASWKKMVSSSSNYKLIDNCIVIGGSSITSSKYLLDKNSIKDGELSIIEFDKGIENVYSDFLEFLIVSRNEYDELAMEIENGFDFENI